MLSARRPGAPVPGSRGGSFCRPAGTADGPSSRLYCCNRRVVCQGAAEEESAVGQAPGYRGSDFVRQPLVSPYKRSFACRRCSGAGSIACTQCGGSGRLARGGYHKRNPVNASRVVGSKWTAMERTFGWRHFRVLQKRGQGKATYVLMAATCDEQTQFWVAMQNLKDRDRWASGWLQKQEIQGLERQRQQDGGGTACKACGASGSLPCPLCSLAGQVVEL